jgi:RNA polymerase sigma-70 factor, ECF subfamily
MQEQAMIEALRTGDEAAFAALIDAYHGQMVRLALVYVHDTTAAEDVVQETWIAVFKGIGSFGARSSLKTWIFSILINRAKTRSTRDGKHAHLAFADHDDEPYTVSPDRFLPKDDPHYPGAWQEDPQSWANVPEAHMLSQETLGIIQATMDALPPQQRQVMLLHDVQGWLSDEICNLLSITETNQRVLLHRARARVRQALATYFEDVRDGS